MPQFVKDVEEIRRRAAEKMEDGAVTQSYRGDVDKAISILNEALATEIVCVLRYMHHYFMATGVHAKAVSAEFKEPPTPSANTPTFWPSAFNSSAASPISIPKACLSAPSRSMWKARRWRT